jgi:drug/metabolite transporter (DMT)-like permease
MNGTDLAAVVFGLASALSWGAGDFSGGLASKRAPVFAVITVGHAVGLALLVALIVALGETPPPLSSLAWGVAAGTSGALGLAALNRALAIGRMGLVAPLSAVLTAALPVLFGAATQGLPGVWKLVGFALALLGIWLIGGAEEWQGGRGGIGLALLAGCGFGAFFILIAQASQSAVFWPLAAARSASLTLALVVAFYQHRESRTENQLTVGSRFLVLGSSSVLVSMLLSGALDVAGNAFFVLATKVGRLDIAAVLASLYPASTVLLAAILLGERISRPQALGIAAVLAAIALITV